MIHKITKDIFFLSRLFVVFYLSLFLLVDYPNINYLPPLLLSAYFINNIYIYFFSRPKFLRILAIFFDITLIPAFIFLINNVYALYSLTILINLYTPRKFPVALIQTTLASLLTFYYFKEQPLILTAHLLLFTGVLFSSYNFEYVAVINKERKRIKKLKKDYNTLLKEFSKYEKEKRMFKNLRLIFKLLRESKEPREYLSKVKREFGVKKIKVIPTSSTDGGIRKDYEKGVLIVPVKFDLGYADIIYELNSPFQLRDDVYVYSLIEAAKLLSVMIEGFEEEQISKEVLVVG